MLILNLGTEILILWILYILYMGILVYRKGPLGGIFFYPKVVQDRVVTLGLITKEEIKKRRAFAVLLYPLRRYTAHTDRCDSGGSIPPM